jgi:3'-5' exoribonuclease
MGNINDFRAGDTLTSFFLVRKAECKSTNSGSKYLDMVLGDSGGEISAKMWDCTPQDEAQYVPNILVKIKGNIVEWQGKKQLKIEKIRLVNEEDGVSIRDFVPAAPYEPEEMYSELLQYAAKIGHDKIRELVGLIIDDCGERLKTYPAALQNHHSIRSGLLYHILTMLKAGERLAEVYPILDKDLLYAGIILHDIAKLDELKAGELGLASEYTTELKKR